MVLMKQDHDFLVIRRLGKNHNFTHFPPCFAVSFLLSSNLERNFISSPKAWILGLLDHRTCKESSSLKVTNTSLPYFSMKTS
ncbi:hypothetical protein QL285_050073 [Trifolium repens]|nr:hypothetical protein QL285_050073 [Trifolium repens]